MGARTYDENPDLEHLATVDEADRYEVDEAHVYRSKKTGKLLLVTASGCSCWNGDYNEETYDSLDELEYALVHRERDYNPSLSGVDSLMAQARKEPK